MSGQTPSPGMQFIEVPANAKAVALIVLGDSDRDGKMGVKPLFFADLPNVLDGKEGLEPVDFINKAIPEFDSVGEKAFPAVIEDLTTLFKPALGFIAKLTGYKRK